MTVMPVPLAPDGEAEYHELLRQAAELRTRAYERRREAVLRLHRLGHRPPQIARELAEEACRAGCSEAEIGKLGISEHNVRLILRSVGLLP